MSFLEPERKIHNLYEINSPVYLDKLSKKYNRSITLGNIPDVELNRIANFGMDALWLMGIWQRSQVAVDLSRQNEDLMREIREVLPDLHDEDLIGSAYAISSYEIDERLGDEQQLSELRHRLADRGLKLILDFVPNHTAFDHPWVKSHPAYYIYGSEDDMTDRPDEFYRSQGTIVARARDPFFPPWPDVAQLNAFDTDYRQASIDTLSRIASMCDGVRCDMAMLVTNDVFAKTWGERADGKPGQEYWQTVIPAVREKRDDFIFIAECYWDMQPELINQGFDYCYDKDVYDHLVSGDLDAARERVGTTSHLANQSIYFLENHDEPRAASTIARLDDYRRAVDFINTLGGMKLWHDGQFEGFRTKVPVHVRRGPHEVVNSRILAMYQSILKI